MSKFETPLLPEYWQAMSRQPDTRPIRIALTVRRQKRRHNRHTTPCLAGRENGRSGVRRDHLRIMAARTPRHNHPSSS